ncbi:hypothetical protein [Pseudomonas sp. XK-1]
MAVKVLADIEALEQAPLAQRQLPQRTYAELQLCAKANGSAL